MHTFQFTYLFAGVRDWLTDFFVDLSKTVTRFFNTALSNRVSNDGSREQRWRVYQLDRRMSCTYRIQRFLAVIHYSIPFDENTIDITTSLLLSPENSHHIISSQTTIYSSGRKISILVLNVSTWTKIMKGIWVPKAQERTDSFDRSWTAWSFFFQTQSLCWRDLLLPRMRHDRIYLLFLVAFVDSEQNIPCANLSSRTSGLVQM